MKTIDDLTPAQQELARQVITEAAQSFEERGVLLSMADADRVDKRAVAEFWFGPHAMDEVAR